MHNVLRDMGVEGAVGAHRVFRDTDRALEWAEDRLIESEAGPAAGTAECRLEDLAVLGGLSPAEWTILLGLMERREYEHGAVVFREGDEGAELFIIARGTASANLSLAENRQIRLATFSTGTVFGEVALLDEGTRSATIEAEGHLVCWVLTRREFELIVREHPTIAVRLLANLGRELSQRLRRANRAIYQLDS